MILSHDTDSHDIRGRYHNPAHGGVLFSTRLPPNNMVPDQLNWCANNPRPEAPCIWTGTQMFVSVRSFHSGGVNMCLADGSVSFVSDGVDTIVFKAGNLVVDAQPTAADKMMATARTRQTARIEIYLRLHTMESIGLYRISQ